jgi:hypothetical protein
VIAKLAKLKLRSQYKYVMTAIAQTAMSNLATWVVMVIEMGRSLTCHYSNKDLGSPDCLMIDLEYDKGGWKK